MVLTLVLAESSIELVPNEIAGHKTILASARRKDKDSRRLILDQTYHHSAILRLGASSIHRGRPDIAHFSLLLALGSPLNAAGKLRCFIHTADDHVISVNSRVRLPRNTDRFTALLEQLYEQSVVPTSGVPLLSLRRQSLPGLIRELSGDLVVALSMKGAPKAMEDIALELERARIPIVLVGGFPRGHFSKRTAEASSETYRIDSRPLDAWTVAGRSVYDYERAIGLRRF